MANSQVFGPLFKEYHQGEGGVYGWGKGGFVLFCLKER